MINNSHLTKVWYILTFKRDAKMFDLTSEVK